MGHFRKGFLDLNDTDKQQELLAALALDALDADEARELAAQIESDDRLARELETFRGAAAQIALSVSPQEPSAAVRSNILAAIKTAPQNKPAPKFRLEKGAAQSNSGAGGNIVQFPTRQKVAFWSYAPTVGAIAASIVAVFLGVALYLNASGNSARVNELNQRLANAEQKLTEANARLEREQQEREFIASPSSFVAALDGANDWATAKARLVFDKQTGRAMLFVENLPDAPAGKAYQIWWISDPKNPTPGGVFHTDHSGKGVLRDQIPPAHTKATIFAVTLEPEGGSSNPTSKPVLITPVS